MSICVIKMCVYDVFVIKAVGICKAYQGMILSLYKVQPRCWLKIS